MIKELEYLFCEERLKELGLFSLEKSLKDLIHVYKHPVAGSKLLFMFKYKNTFAVFQFLPFASWPLPDTPERARGKKHRLRYRKVC